jgi:hypothetical protein
MLGGCISQLQLQRGGSETPKHYVKRRNNMRITWHVGAMLRKTDLN